MMINNGLNSLSPDTCEVGRFGILNHVNLVVLGFGEVYGIVEKCYLKVCAFKLAGSPGLGS